MESTNSPTKPVAPLSDETLRSIEARESVPRNGEMLVVLKSAERDALCQTVRAAWVMIDQYKSRTAYDWANIIETLQSENTALREQLAQAHANVESLSQIIFRSEHATAMRNACVAKVEDFDDWVWCQCSECRTDGRSHAIDIGQSLKRLVAALSSLTLEQVEQKQ